MTRGLWAAGAFIFALFAGLCISFAIERCAHQGVVARNVRCGGVALGGMDQTQVERALGALEKRLNHEALTIQLGEHQREARAGELGIVFDPVNVERALSVGRKRWIGPEFGFWLARLFSSYELVPGVRIERAQLKKALEPWSKEFLAEPVLPSITYHKELSVVAGQAGEVLDYEQLTGLLEKWAREFFLSSAAARATVPIQVRSLVLDPRISATTVNERKRQVEQLLVRPILVVSSDGAQRISLSPDVLGQALGSESNGASRELSLSLSMAQIRPKIAAFLAQVERPARDAVVSFDRANTATITTSEAGWLLDEPAFVAALWGASRAEQRKVILPLVKAEPKLTTSDAEGLKLKGLVSQFMTRHACCQPRVDNIHLAASKLDGTVLRPGEKFSLNDLLGPRSRGSGYKSAPAIVRGEMEDVYGGGISQLATTLFNAALRGGYKIIQRQPHSVYFSRYPEGHEATVSFPLPDLSFENDTDAGLLIKTEYTGTFIKVLFYGDVGGRVVSLNKSARYHIVKPPIEYEPNEHMDPEKPKRLRAGQMGWTVVVSRKVRFPDGHSNEEKREVVYNPRAELLRVHPCVIPEGEKGYTGEKCPEPDEFERDEQPEELSSDVYYETSNLEYDEDGG